MTQYDLKVLKKKNIPDLMELWDAVYPKRELPKEYWEWMFKCPLPWVSSGLYEKKKLLAHYGAIVHTDMKGINYGHTFSSMSHPNYRHKGLYQKAAINLYTELEWHHKCKYAQFFSNLPIHRTHQKMGAIDIYQIKEYRIPINKVSIEKGENFYPVKPLKGSYEEWRYILNPLKAYIWYANKKTDDYIIMNKYENRLQIIDYSNLEKILGLAAFIGSMLKCDTIAFWDVQDLEYEFVYIPEWLMIYPFNRETSLELVEMQQLIEQKQKEKVWMGMHDSY